MEDPYEILGVDKGASKADIRKAYRSKANKMHPDKNLDDQEGAKAKFQQLSRAYTILSDDEKRERYDQTGSMEDGAMTLDETAESVILEILLTLAEQNSFNKKNYLKEVQGQLSQHKTKCEQMAKSFASNLEKLTYLIENTNASSRIMDGLELKKSKIEHEKQQTDHGIRVYTRALEIVKDFKYTGEAAEPTSPHHNTFAGMHNHRFFT